ncbi:ATP phosphoribosyltransferase regulatory subunit [Clostridiaceae bacterium UIB06]|uniref:ATP phosphoribosyltransferase regulatory subunit n=1 Tax=Clostridium thailandense TaxID=2794346 RepID=A0A949TSA4_9CLOT|nr:ATP phosphoribosyltransferase regulatory subunit [Clostridium thailandense]MBV7274452.1 ATP phosphoribosyltransferase regulatory subunit [Clostridium thailandense]MCH5136638.1 ATP phosphoribosyltransferase regulatory subunit [Clostridiaceae bacterium UIB06]
MFKWKRYIPEGGKDTLFEECAQKIEIEDILRKTYIDCGYQEVISPTLEFYDVFIGENATLPQEKMYKLFDNQGRILVLRPDMTTPIARIAATKFQDASYPLKLCYTSNIYRVNERLNGKNSEITQSGIEIIGVKSLKADVEAIIMGINALIKCGLKDFKIELGQAEFFKAVIEDVNIGEEDREKLIKYIENKNLAALSEFVEDKSNEIGENALQMLKELPRLFGDIGVLDRAEELTNNAKVLDAIKSIRKVYKIIESAGFGEYLSVDLGMVQHLDYYTGIIFRGYAHGVGGNILSGGRYDNLIGQFGLEKPATGFALDVDSIILALDNKEKSSKEKVLIYYSEESLIEAYKKAEEFRKKNIIAEMSLLDSEDEAVNYAKNKGIIKVIKV